MGIFKQMFENYFINEKAHTELQEDIDNTDKQIDDEIDLHSTQRLQLKRQVGAIRIDLDEMLDDIRGHKGGSRTI